MKLSMNQLAGLAGLLLGTFCIAAWISTAERPELINLPWEQCLLIGGGTVGYGFDITSSPNTGSVLLASSFCVPFWFLSMGFVLPSALLLVPAAFASNGNRSHARSPA